MTAADIAKRQAALDTAAERWGIAALISGFATEAQFGRKPDTRFECPACGRKECLWDC